MKANSASEPITEMKTCYSSEPKTWLSDAGNVPIRERVEELDEDFDDERAGTADEDGKEERAVRTDENESYEREESTLKGNHRG